jgi:hypothetical protein
MREKGREKVNFVKKLKSLMIRLRLLRLTRLYHVIHVTPFPRYLIFFNFIKVYQILLWVIYYDPLFQAINETNFGGLTLSTSIPKNINNRNHDFHSITLNFKLLGYLDDTTWISDNLQNLSNHLKIEDKFYEFANIKINKTKTKLITNNRNLLTQTSTPFQFGNEQINVTITPKSKGERILGVYFNPLNNNNFTINKIKRILHNLKFSLSLLMITLSI